MNEKFEDFLKSKHAEEYHGTDDDMPEAFEAWLGDLSAEEFIEFADEYGVEQFKKGQASK